MDLLDSLSTILQCCMIFKIIDFASLSFDCTVCQASDEDRGALQRATPAVRCATDRTRAMVQTICLL